MLDSWPIALGARPSVAASATSIGVCGSGPMSVRNFVLSSRRGRLPQIAHFEHFVKGVDEWRG